MTETSTTGDKHYITPFVLPVAAFALVIGAGALLLFLDANAARGSASFVDSLFTATSAVCVTGLASVDVFSTFNRAGQGVVLALVQLGGIGIVTYSTLVFYMLDRRISLRDRMAVEQVLFYDPSFNLGRFLQRMILTVFFCEAAGAAVFFFLEPERIGFFNALFLSVSAFCNAGFAPWQDSLAQWRGHWGMNVAVMTLIITGGLGYFVIEDMARVLLARLKAPGPRSLRLPVVRLRYYSRIVLATSLFLILAGAAAIFALEPDKAVREGVPLPERALISLFQSVTSRTAGFSTTDMELFSDAALLVTMLLMFIGGSPGSCAGGIKTTTFRILWGNLVAQLRGHSQIIVAGRAMSPKTCNKAALLFCYALLTVILTTFALVLTENGHTHHGAAPFGLMELFFEVVSAFGTVGLSINVTPRLSDLGKLILCGAMLIGKIGPVWLISTIQQFQSDPAFRYPTDSMPVG
ncbi:MAG: potassium transporter TrkH [Deltaproteobacteria bacterium]|jgi:trk system potassium uptake protein TrkH|nr:potassium transporter TrkH [Deltaproteobacteria bacterium]